MDQGSRVLTQFAQDAWPINNEDLVYVFQGLTKDGRYYISAFLPVTASFLPEHVDDAAAVPAVDGIPFPAFNSSDFGSEYASYQKAVRDKLNASSPEEFSPALDTLDTLIESLRVGLSAATAVPATQALPVTQEVFQPALRGRDSHPLTGELVRLRGP